MRITLGAIDYAADTRVSIELAPRRLAALRLSSALVDLAGDRITAMRR
jgi:hypothetical protein